MSSPKRPDGTYTNNEEERAIQLLETHFPGSHLFQHTTVDADLTKPTSASWNKANLILTRKTDMGPKYHPAVQITRI